MQKKLIFIFCLIISVLLYGTIGYMIVARLPFIDALYMTVITLSTVGYREIIDFNNNGKIFTILLIFSSIGVFTYALTTGAKIVIEGELKEVFKKKAMQKRINQLEDHYILCGYGRMGRIILKELMANNIPVVVIEKEKANIPDLEKSIFIEGDATDDEILKSAGIHRAKGLISVLPSDTENLFVVMSAKELNPSLFIVARAATDGAEKKLKRAGADRVVSPYHIGGLKIAHTVIKPSVVDFLEFVTRSEHLEIQIEEIEVLKGSTLVGKTIRESGIGMNLGIIIVGIKAQDGTMKFNPGSQTVIEEGDILIVLGESDKLSIFEDIARGKHE